MPVSEKSLVLHVGTHKTGTTALQQGLLHARPLMLEAGFDILVPTHFAVKLGEAVKDIPIGSVPQRAQKVGADLRKTVETALTKRSVIVSSEHFSGVVQEGYSDSDIRASALASVFCDVPTQVVVYYRRQDAFIESMYNHRIHQGYTESFDEFLNTFDPLQFEWLRHVSHFYNAFGKENVTLRSYDSLKKCGGILPDFLQILGIPPNQANLIIETANQAPRQNRGYSPPALALARNANRILDSQQKKHLRHLLQNQLGDTKDAFGEHSHFTPEQRRDLLKHFETSNRKLCQEALIDWETSGFVPDEANHDSPTAEPTIEDEIVLLSKIMVAVSMKVESLTESKRKSRLRSYIGRVLRWLRRHLGS